MKYLICYKTTTSDTPYANKGRKCGDMYWFQVENAKERDELVSYLKEDENIVFLSFRKDYSAQYVERHPSVSVSNKGVKVLIDYEK